LALCLAKFELARLASFPMRAGDGEAREPAVAACRRALEGRPSAEARRRLEAFLANQRQESVHPSAESLRRMRAVEVLEMAGTRQAHQLLGSIARGAAEARLTQEAKVSFERLSGRPAQ